MRKTSRNGTFIVNLIINVLINIEWSIPAWILLILHFVTGISLWWFVGALALWFLLIGLCMIFISLANKNAEMPKTEWENKNPYSAKEFPFVDDNGKGCL